MLQDRYGNGLSTTSVAARDTYVDAMDRFLAAEEGVEEGFESAIAHDPDFALAHIALARHHQMVGKTDRVRQSLKTANAAKGLTDCEAANVKASTLLMSGKAKDAYPLIRTHLIDHPRDAMLASTCMGVFGLIGFSGQPGREAEQLAFTTSLAPHYGDDWWFLGVHAFAEMEAGRIGPAEKSIERSLEQRPGSANGAHYRSHLYYENGECDAGYTYVSDWMEGYSRAGVMHTHISWHIALWALERGDEETMWSVIDSDVAPGAGSGPSINVITDTASFLYRAELAGISVPPDKWNSVSDYAAKIFPEPGVAFVDVHAALAHAISGNSERLENIITNARGPAADIVRELAESFRAIAEKKWSEAEAHLIVTMADHARIGGSRAQRDLIEFAMSGVLMRQGRTAEAQRLLAIRRPHSAPANAIKDLSEAV